MAQSLERREEAKAERASSGRTPVLKQAVHRLQRLALAASPGAFLGTEAELRESLGISRPTFRQAVQILEQDQLLMKRMGPQGGCYAHRPDPSSVSRRAALFLQAEGTTLQDLLDVLHGLQQLALADAAAGNNAEARDRLREFLQRARIDSALDNVSAFVERERQFEMIVLDIGGNPALRLFFQIARKFVDDSPASQVLVSSLALRRVRADAWLQIGEAVMIGDAQGALDALKHQNHAFLAFMSRPALEAKGIRHI